MIAAFALALTVGTVLSLTVRTGPWPARLCAVLAMLLVAIAAFAPKAVDTVLEPARLRLVGTDPVALGEVAAALRARAEPQHPAPDVAVLAGPDLRRELARAALAAGPRLGERVVVWTEPLPEVPAVSGRAAGHAFTSASPVGFAATDLALEFAGIPTALRPAAATASLRGPLRPVPARLAVLAGSESATADGEVGGGRALRVEFVPPEIGQGELEITATSGGYTVRRLARFGIGEPEVVLVVDASGAMASALAAQGLRVRSAASLPDDLDGVGAVVLGDELGDREQEVLVAAVRSGLGLFAFGAGLQRDGGPLREILPLRWLPARARSGGAGDAPTTDRSPPTADPPPEAPPPKTPDRPEIDPAPPAEVDKHAVAMVLVIDRSGSMGTRVLGGGTKMSYAKTSAQKTASALGHGDMVAVVTFGNDEQARIEVPLTDALDRATVERGLERLAHANESTYLDHGLVTALGLLGGSTAAVRHVVVLTDGEVWDPELVLRRRANTMRQQGITLSIVSIVDDRTLSNFLGMAERVAREGGGSFLPVRDVRTVPQLFSAEVERALGRVGRRPRGEGVDPEKPPMPPEKPPEPQPRDEDPAPPPEENADLAVRAVARSPLLLPEVVDWPRLRAIRPAVAKDSAHVLLAAGDAGAPLLAFGNTALGRVGVFAADLADEDAVAFRREPGFPGRFAQWVRSVWRSDATGEIPGPEFTRSTIEPPAPTPREVEALIGLGGSPLLPLGALGLPPPRASLRPRSLVPLHALAACLVLVLLALVERWSVSRTG